MRLGRSFSIFCFCLLSTCLPCAYAQEDLSPKQELEHIDAELRQLNDLKNKYRAAATRHEDEGMRWQFMQDYKQEAKQAFARADMEKEMVQQIQVRIDYLEGKRKELVKNNPGLKQ